jgi:RNA polymerase sigma-70 factor, ECF subfamily
MIRQKGLDNADTHIRLSDPNYYYPPRYPPTVEEVVRRVCEKDQEAFEKLYDHYRLPLGKRLMSIVYDREVVEDLCQETFIRVWKSVTPECAYYFERWIYSIARNLAFDYIQHKKLIEFVSISDSEAPSQIVELRMHGDEDLVCDLLCLKEAVTVMTPQYRICLLAQVYWGYSQKEIAAALNIDVSTVSSNVSRAYQQIQRYRHVLQPALKRALKKCSAQERRLQEQSRDTTEPGLYFSRIRVRRWPGRLRDFVLQPDTPKGLPPRLQQLLREEDSQE